MSAPHLALCAPGPEPQPFASIPAAAAAVTTAVELVSVNTDVDVYRTTQTYDDLLRLSQHSPVAKLVIGRVWKRSSTHKQSLDVAYRYKREVALGLKPPERKSTRGIRRRSRTSAAPVFSLDSSSSSGCILAQDSLDSPPAALPPSLPAVAAPDQIADLVARVEQQERELIAVRAELQRAVRLAEQVSTDNAILQQQQQLQQQLQGSRKRKQTSTAIDPASLFDTRVYSPEETQQTISSRFEIWRMEENRVTVGWACIEAVLTLLNYQLQLANNEHVRFLPSYQGMQQQNSDDAVNERCMGINLAQVRYVVAPVSVNENHWALVVWDNADHQLLLLDSLGSLVTNAHGTRLRRIMTNGAAGRAKVIRVSVVQQQDLVSCGLFALFFACYMVRNGTSWRETISEAMFSVQGMRDWLEQLKAVGAHEVFTLEQLPTFSAAEDR